jgi:hypothetical protein
MRGGSLEAGGRDLRRYLLGGDNRHERIGRRPPGKTEVRWHGLSGCANPRSRGSRAGVTDLRVRCFGAWPAGTPLLREGGVQGLAESERWSW